MLVLFRALVPDVHVEMVSIMSIDGQGFYLCVRPDHSKYWTRFKERYFDSEKSAQERGAKIEVTCPEFTQERPY